MTGLKRWGLFSLFVVLLASPGVTARAQETPAAAKPAGTVADLSWLVGRWQGRMQGPRGLQLEQHWTEPRSGVMMGMFRLSDPTDNNRVLLLEFI